MAKTIKYNKLVRDLIPDIIEKSGKTYVTHIAKDSEYTSHLYKKVREELEEFIENPSEEEMADILEVLDHISNQFNLNRKKIEQVKEQKNIVRGSFKKKIILEEVIED
ncbi:nucleoside triphosphate pyrophosphohydrolase [Haloplasma contractile]|uniref:Phosphoribosyl-ATP pyrophosphohydrolase protein n=1 Tax=Haloplasma contractile SSD-17B TaxID=1033810 RepID=U2FG14_9MOLU|nr:nucleoside triphosphate pyrophosphohydrolase [Haloplasma contractile]ERJ11840.1 hypothetical protein HLPCO_002079 [Haloplasma contractile SSD-17B]